LVPFSVEPGWGRKDWRTPPALRRAAHSADDSQARSVTVSGRVDLAINKHVQKLQALLVRQAAVVYHLHDVTALVVRRQIVPQRDGGLMGFCSRNHVSNLSPVAPSPST